MLYKWPKMFFWKEQSLFTSMEVLVFFQTLSHGNILCVKSLVQCFKLEKHNSSSVKWLNIFGYSCTVCLYTVLGDCTGAFVFATCVCHQLNLTEPPKLHWDTLSWINHAMSLHTLARSSWHEQKTAYKNFSWNMWGKEKKHLSREKRKKETEQVCVYINVNVYTCLCICRSEKPSQSAQCWKASGCWPQQTQLNSTAVSFSNIYLLPRKLGYTGVHACSWSLIRSLFIPYRTICLNHADIFLACYDTVSWDLFFLFYS